MYRLIVSVFIIILSVEITYSQEIKFENITTEHGLAQNSIRCIYQDSDGYVWFGTEEGLSRYDGYSFTNFRSESGDTTSLTDNLISSIIEDQQGNLWIATFSGNLNRFNRKTEKFRQYLISNQISINTAPFNAIARLYEDREFNLWAFNLAVYKYLPQQDIFKQIDLKIDRDDFSILFIYQDSNNLFWIGTSRGLYSYNWLDGTYKSYRPLYLVNNSADIAYFSIAEDPGGIFWLGSSRGLFEFDKNSGKFLNNYQIDNDIKRSLVYTDIPSLINDRQYLWMTWQTWNNNTIGISKLNKMSEDLSVYTFSDDKMVGPSDNVRINMFEDKSGIIWVGTYLSGIYKFEKESKFFTMMKNNTVCAFLEDKNGYLWIATSKNGLFKYDEKSKTLLNIPTFQLNSPINVMYEDSRGTIWVGTYTGLYRIKSLEEVPSSVQFEQVLPDIVKSITEDLRHMLWIGIEGSLCVLNPEDKSKIYFYSEPDNPNSLINSSVEAALTDTATGHIWIATWGGLNKLIVPSKTEITKDNVRFISFQHEHDNINSISDNKVISLCLDKKGTLWAGTYGEGINSIELLHNNEKGEEKYKIRRYSKENGLPNNVIYGILSDNKNNIWVSSNNGLSMLNQGKGSIKNFDKNDGLQGNEFFWRSYYKGKSGKMYFGGINGYNAFYPDSIRFNSYLPPVKITGFSIFNKLMAPGDKDSPLSIQIEETKEITIDYNQSVISFDYVALNYLASHKNNYAYMIEGFDKDWHYVGNQRKATYTNLDPGKYIFRVKASNNDGIWNEEGTSIRLTIIPPFWMTWWFKLFIIIILSLTLLGIYTIRIRAIRQRNKILERMVEKRTFELKLSYDLLKKSSNELNETNTLLEERQQKVEEQSEELMTQKEELIKINKALQELNATKDKFFSIIAHDIKNPFGTIMGFLDLLQLNFRQWTDDKKEQIVNILKETSDNVYSLLENLLQWSRSQRGIIEYNPENLSIKGQINTVLKLLNEAANTKNIVLENLVQEDDIKVYADKRMLDTILRNLIGNAIKFTRSGGKVVIRSCEDNTFQKIEVSDNGVGMTPDQLRNIFKIDSQLSAQGTNNESGTGLGLILCKEFIDKHGGNISVESEPEKGSTFCFTIPKSKNK
ncbi:MAG: hypothetical protein JW894_14360 [Bacteroidales bacterium]|nr:hypothetical protein [Bacteroidales bacterium]